MALLERFRDVSCWPKCEVPSVSSDGRYQGRSRHRIMRRRVTSHFDPKRASLWCCVKRLDAYSITLSARESSVSGMLSRALERS